MTLRRPMARSTGPALAGQPPNAADPGVHLIGEGDHTTNTNLAAALISAGISPNPIRPWERFRGDGIRGERLAFFFRPASEDGTIVTAEMIAVWTRFSEFVSKNPNHPFAYTGTAIRNRERILNYLKTGLPHLVCRAGRTLAVLPHEEDGAEMPPVEVLGDTTRRQPIGMDCHQISVPGLAAALLAVGVPLCHDATHHVKPGGQVWFSFESVGAIGMVSQLVAAWDTIDDWIKEHPEHPFAYAAIAIKNRERLLDFVKGWAPQIVVASGKANAIIREDAPQADIDRVLARLERVGR